MIPPSPWYHYLNLGVAWLLAAAWCRAAIGAALGMPKIADLCRAEWDIPAEDISLIAKQEHPPKVTIVVPARNEEHTVEPALRSLLELDYPNYEVIAVNDRSTDATGEVMARVAALPQAQGHLRVLQISELPGGWLGKTHAMWRAAGEAGGDWLLFTDADVHFRRDALRRAVAYAERERADHLVVAPTLMMHSVGERMMTAFFQTAFLFTHRPWRVADPKSKDHIGVGAFNLVRRSAYRAVGGYERLRMAVLDDMRLGDEIKRAGFAQRFAMGRGLARVRWAHGATGMVRNLNKNVFAYFGYRAGVALGAVALLLLLQVGPSVGVFTSRGWAQVGYALALLTIVAVYAGMSRRSDISPLYVLLHPLSTLLFAYIIVQSTLTALCRGGVVWRGTKYPLDELREAAGNKQ